MKKIHLSVIALLVTCSLFATSFAKTHIWVLAMAIGLTGAVFLVRKNKKQNQPALALVSVSK